MISKRSKVSSSLTDSMSPHLTWKTPRRGASTGQRICHYVKWPGFPAMSNLQKLSGSDREQDGNNQN